MLAHLFPMNRRTWILALLAAPLAVMEVAGKSGAQNAVKAKQTGFRALPWDGRSDIRVEWDGRGIRLQCGNGRFVSNPTVFL